MADIVLVAVALGIAAVVVAIPSVLYPTVVAIEAPVVPDAVVTVVVTILGYHAGAIITIANSMIVAVLPKSRTRNPHQVASLALW